MIISVVSLGVKFNGRCIKCGVDTGGRDFEKGSTLLCRKPDGKFCVAHAGCTGGRVIGKVAGSRQYSGPMEFEA